MKLSRVVIAGGSIAGLTAVEALRSEGFEGQITLLGEESSPPYTRVPLSKAVLAGASPLSETLLTLPSDDVDFQLNTRATGLDLDKRLVHTTAGAVPFDGLVIATGSCARRLGGPDQDERVLRTQLDCTRLQADLTQASSVVIVGGGFLGMEIASTCRQLGKDVTVVDLVPPLDRLVGPVVGGHIRRIAASRGVRIVVARGGVSLLGAPRPTAVRTPEETIDADLVVSAVGDMAKTDWLAGSGIVLERGGVVVDEHSRAGEHVVAAGDVAVSKGADGRVVRSPHWTNAVEQARVAALALLQRSHDRPHRRSTYCWTQQFGLELKMVGEPGPRGRPTVIDGSLADNKALLGWPDATVPRTVIALNYPTPPAKLKRLVVHG